MQEEIKETRYTKKQLTTCKKFASKRDILNVLLDSNKTYSFEEIEKLLNGFSKKKFK